MRKIRCFRPNITGYAANLVDETFYNEIYFDFNARTINQIALYLFCLSNLHVRICATTTTLWSFFILQRIFPNRHFATKWLHWNNVYRMKMCGIWRLRVSIKKDTFYCLQYNKYIEIWKCWQGGFHRRFVAGQKVQIIIVHIRFCLLPDFRGAISVVHN